MNASPPAHPLVTVAIPLYHSRPFLENIVANIRALDYPNLEVLIGDRHLADDTVDHLRASFPGDTRIRYITARDELNWVEHYNALLREATGEYFLWMPHDDSYPPDYIRLLVARLEETPAAVLAFGRMESESLDGRRTPAFEPPPLVPGERWSTRTAFRLLYTWNLGIAMRGVFRRTAVVEHGLWIRPTRGLVQADVCWLFGLACLGRFEYVPEASCLKRFHGQSAHARWSRLDRFDRTRVMAAYLRGAQPTPATRARVFAFLALGYSVAAVAVVAGKAPQARRIGRSLRRRVLSRLL